MRDFETIETALLAADRTPRPVHADTLDATKQSPHRRRLPPPPSDSRSGCRLQCAQGGDLDAPDTRVDGKGRVPAVEILISAPFIRECIMDKEKTHLL